MPLLVILSAILSLFTGVMSGTRVQDAQGQPRSGVVAAADAVRSTRIACRQAIRTYLALADGWSDVAARRAFAHGAAFVLRPLAPLYRDRPRE